MWTRYIEETDNPDLKELIKIAADSMIYNHTFSKEYYEEKIATTQKEIISFYNLRSDITAFTELLESEHNQTLSYANTAITERTLDKIKYEKLLLELKAAGEGNAITEVAKRFLKYRLEQVSDDLDWYTSNLPVKPTIDDFYTSRMKSLASRLETYRKSVKNVVKLEEENEVVKKQLQDILSRLG